MDGGCKVMREVGACMMKDLIMSHGQHLSGADAQVCVVPGSAEALVL